jgi:hypothetical protein
MLPAHVQRGRGRSTHSNNLNLFLPRWANPTIRAMGNEKNPGQTPPSLCEFAWTDPFLSAPKLDEPKLFAGLALAKPLRHQGFHGSFRYLLDLPGLLFRTPRLFFKTAG